MENPKNNIKDPKVRAYFEDITEGKEPSVRLSADELENGISQFDEGMKNDDGLICSSIRIKEFSMARSGELFYFLSSAAFSIPFSFSNWG